MEGLKLGKKKKKTGEELMSIQEPCTQMFTEALFIVGKTWKQPRYLIGEWINKLWCIQTMECYSVVKKEQVSKP